MQNNATRCTSSHMHMLRSTPPMDRILFCSSIDRGLRAPQLQKPVVTQFHMQRQSRSQGDHGMSICAAVASAFGVQLVLQQPCLAQSQPLASLDNLSIEQVVTRGTSAPNLTHLLSQGDTSPNEQLPSTGQPSLDPQNLLPVTPDTPVPSTSGLSTEAGPSVPSAASPTTPSAPEDPQKTEEEQRKSLRKTRRSRIKELEDTRLELAEKQLKLIEREKELLDKDQTVSTLREELDLERKLRALLTKEKDKAEEEAALAMGLCTGAFTLP